MSRFNLIAILLFAPAPLLPADDSAIDPVTLTPSSEQTVDSDDRVPAAGPNNPEKFEQGSLNDGIANPYTSTLYLRSHNFWSQRRVRAFVRFDLSPLTDLPVAGATLSFGGHSLNDDNSTDIQVVVLAADWSESASPPPTWDHATESMVINGGDVSSGLDSSNNTKDYSFDITTAVRNWIDGIWPNHGLQIRLDPVGVNNGVGIDPVPDSGLQLLVEQVPLVVTGFLQGPNPDDVTLEWNSLPGAVYQVQANDDIEGAWTPVAEVPGADAATTTTYTHVDGMTGFSQRFYRLAFLRH